MKKYVFVLQGVIFLLLTACSGLKYSFVGVDIPPDAKTVSVKPFQNNASLVNLKLSNQITTALKDKFQSQTKLNIIDLRGDLQFEGEITNYSVLATAVGVDKAAVNRLTITVRVSFVNKLDETKNYEQNFSRYADYDSSKTLAQVEDELVSQICEALIDDIFSKAVGNW
ncbi:MAG TPA: LptE family protein [Bacteroidales bacterium]|nr:LptE family protein [Bacteroidales bacterium]HOS15669.1 LptE family protein [Bacteroidales bacterium]